MQTLPETLEIVEVSEHFLLFHMIPKLLSVTFH